MYIKLSHYTDVDYKNILVQYWPNLQWLDFIAIIEKQRFDYILVISKTKVVKPAAVVVKPYSIQLLFYFIFEISILILSIILQHISVF